MPDYYNPVADSPAEGGLYPKRVPVAFDGHMAEPAARTEGKTLTERDLPLF